MADVKSPKFRPGDVVGLVYRDLPSGPVAALGRIVSVNVLIAGRQPTYTVALHDNPARGLKSCVVSVAEDELSADVSFAGQSSGV